MGKDRARELRKKLTEAEKMLWNHLRLRQMGDHKFRRQQPIGRYIVDFVCLEKRLIIEVGGGQHNERSAYDSNRDSWLISQGYRILRFWNNQIFGELEAVKETIFETLKKSITPTLTLPLRGGGIRSIKNFLILQCLTPKP
jgi:very-short-patch-repair endonuclease